MIGLATHSIRSQAVPAGRPRVLFACGGTGGHVYPAIAIADQVRTQAPAAAVAFAGTRERIEWEAVPKAGYTIYPIAAAGFQRGIAPAALARNVALPLKLVSGLAQSLRLIGRFDPDVVVGTGGYVTGPVGLASAMRRRPLVLQEQNAYAGATNRLLARFAARVFVAFEAALEYFPIDKSVVAGNPVRQDLTAVDPGAARAHFGLTGEEKVVLVMGGSLGAGAINQAIEDILGTLLDRGDTAVIWQTGTRFFADLEQRIATHPRLRLLPYLDRMDYAYAVADVAVCRAGAITCSELAVTATPAILVPSPNVTADHQTKNARAMSEAGAAILLPEGEIADGLLPALDQLLNRPEHHEAMREAARGIARPEAARDIAEAVLALADHEIEEPT